MGKLWEGHERLREFLEADYSVASVESGKLDNAVALGRMTFEKRKKPNVIVSKDEPDALEEAMVSSKQGSVENQHQQNVC